MNDASKSKKALVLLHGFCENKSLWDHIIPELYFKGQIIAPDLPGFGNAVLNSNKFSLEEIANSIYTDLVKKGIENCICIGHSLGGYVTLALKKNAPDFVTSIGLLHSTAFADTIEKKETRNKLIQFLDNHHASAFLSSFAPSLFDEANKERLKTEIKNVVDMSKGLKNTTIQTYAEAMRDRKDYTSILYNEVSPLFIVGTSDPAISLADSKNLISNINNKINCHILENTAHMGMYESPSLIIEAINQFTSNNQ